MSANIRWRVPKAGKDLDVSATSSFIDAMNEAFGGYNSWTLTKDELGTLRGLYAGTKRPEFKALIDLVEKHGTIEVWAEY